MVANIDPALAINAILGLLGVLGVTGITLWARGKSALHSLRDAFDNLDDAATNGKITEAQFQAVLNDFRKLIKGDPNATAPNTTPTPPTSSG